MKNSSQKPSILVFKNLSGVVTLAGAKKKRGRKISHKDLSELVGPVDIAIESISGKIIFIKKTKKENSPINALIKDCSGLWATPAFYDSHTHSLFSGHRSNEFFLRFAGATYQTISENGGGIHNTQNQTLAAIRNQPLDLFSDVGERLKKMFLSGSYSVEVKSGYAPTAQGELEQLRFLKKFFSKKHIARPRIFKTFLPLHALPRAQKEDEFVSQMIALLPTIKQEGLADFADAFPEKGFFSLEQSLRFAKQAKRFGLGLKIHADELSPLGSTEAFVKLGALSVDHLQKVSKKGVTALSESRTVACLLPSTSFFLGLEYANARKLLSAGAQVALASDFNPGTAPEPELGLTMRLAASQLRMTPWEIFCGISLNGAAALGLANLEGSIETGMQTGIALWKSPTTSAVGLLEEIIITELKPVIWQN